MNRFSSKRRVGTVALQTDMFVYFIVWGVFTQCELAGKEIMWEKIMYLFSM